MYMATDSSVVSINCPGMVRVRFAIHIFFRCLSLIPKYNCFFYIDKMEKLKMSCCQRKFCIGCRLLMQYFYHNVIFFIYSTAVKCTIASSSAIYFLQCFAILLLLTAILINIFARGVAKCQKPVF